MKTKKTTPAQIWCACSYDNCFVGYLVTEPGNINRPIAYVDFVNASTENGFEVARRIRDFFSREPWRAANTREGVGVIDLTAYGLPNSAAPMPGFIYGVRCVPADDGGDETDARDVEPRPWCRFMDASISKQRAGRKAVRK